MCAGNDALLRVGPFIIARRYRYGGLVFLGHGMADDLGVRSSGTESSIQPPPRNPGRVGLPPRSRFGAVRCGAVTSMQVGGDAITITITRFRTDRRGLLARVISGHLGHRPDIPRLRPDQTCLCRLFQRMRDPADDTARREDSRECIAWNQQRFQQ
jgi:hypothetical protein